MTAARRSATLRGNPTPQAARRAFVPVTAGVLAILAGAMGMTFGVLVSFLKPMISLGRLDALAVPMVVLAIIAVLGGAFAVQRRLWPLALLGTICALMLPFTILGIVSLILLAVGKMEFT